MVSNSLKDSPKSDDLTRFIDTESLEQLTFSIEETDTDYLVTYGIFQEEARGSWASNLSPNLFNGSMTLNLQAPTRAVDSEQEIVLWGRGYWHQKLELKGSNDAEQIRNADTGILLVLVPIHKEVVNE